MKTYVLMLAQVFPADHPKAGRPTGFMNKLRAALNGWSDLTFAKLHTIRANYPIWAKRFEQIERGDACLSIRQWSGKPYASKQVEIARLTKEDGIGIQKLYLTDEIDLLGEYGVVESTWELFGIPGDSKVSCKQLANNDGLSYEDWDAWFEKYNKSKPLAIIHFTKFRY